MKRKDESQYANHVCIVTPDLAGPTRNGGVGTHCLHLARFHSGRHDEVTLFHTGAPDDVDLAHWKLFYREQHGANLKFMQEMPAYGDLPVMPHTARHQTAYRLYKWLHLQTFDTIYFQDWQGNGAVCVAAKRAGVAFKNSRLIVSTHGSSEWIREGMREFPVAGRESLIDDALERTALANADLVVSPNEYMLDWLRSHHWHLPNEVGVGPYLFESINEPSRALGPGELIEIVFFGRLETRKGIEPFLAAIELLAPELKHSLQVTLLGRHHTTLVGPSRDLVDETAGRLHGKVKLKVYGEWNHHQALDYLRERKGTLIVTPSLADNSPFAVIECLSLGVPLLASSRGGIPELIASPEHLIEPTANAIAERLRTIIAEGLPPVRSRYSDSEARKAWRAIAELPPTTPPAVRPPRISVCIPHYEQPSQLRTALAALVRQTQAAAEIIVVDDGSSTAATRAALSALEREFGSHGVRFIHQTNAGPAAARNAAARMATGSALVFCDADNRPYPNMLEALGRALVTSGAPIVTCAFRAVRAEDDPDAKTDQGYLFCPLGEAGGLAFLENVLGDTNFIIERELFLELGGFRSLVCEDWEFLLRASLAGHDRAVVPDPLFDYVIERQSRARTHSALSAAQSALTALPDAERARYQRLFFAMRGTFEQQGVNLSHRVAALEDEVRSLHRNLFFTAQQKEELAREFAQERGGFSESMLRLHEALQRAHTAEEQVARTKASLSWRLTSPLRALRRAWGRRSASVEVPAAAVPFIYYIEPPSSWEAAPADGTLTGWILQPNRTPVAAVRGHVLGHCYPARYHLPRPDVAELHGKAATFCGLALDYEIPPGEEHPIVLEALLPDGRWQRFFEQMVKASPSSRGGVDYAKWLAARARQDEKPPAPDAGPTISILVPTYNTPERWLRRAVESVKAQTYTRWQLCLADDASTAGHVPALLEELAASDRRIIVKRRAHNEHICAASNTALELAQGEWVVLLDHDDELAPHALASLVQAIVASPDAKFIYSDEDKIDEDGRRFDANFKPDWNPDLLRGQNYCCHLSAFRTDLVREVGGFRAGTEGSQDWDLVLRVTEQLQPSEIVHIPEVLYHWRAIKGSTALALGEKNYTQQAARRALEDHLARTGVVADLIPVEGGHWRIRYPLPAQPPLVSLIIPTHNGEKLVRQCIESLRAKTSYPSYEIILVNNRSNHPESLAYFKGLAAEGVRVLDYDAPFNFSAINNFAVRHAQGTVLGFLNNDLEAVHGDWLDEMVAHALRPEIGAVGALLHYPDGGIQHAGIVLGIAGPMRIGGVAGHAFKEFPRGSDGYFNRLRLAQNYSAVTAACLVIRREIFEQVGGFNETDLPVAFNDVDFCLRVRAAGYRNLWTPFAELYHHESASRGAEDTVEKKARFKSEIDYMRTTWGALLDNDPAYNPNLTLVHEDFSLAWPPRPVSTVGFRQ